MEPQKKTINEIIKEIKDQVELAPGMIAKYRSIITAEYTFQAETLKNIMMKKPSIWMEIRKKEDVKSDTAAERYWGMTELGQKEIELKYRLKYLEKLSSSLRQQLEVMDSEIRGLY